MVSRLGFGRYEKVVLKFARPFWREAGWSHLVLFPPDPAEPAAWVFDLDAFGIGPILVCHVFHSATGHAAGGLADRGGPMGHGPARGGARARRAPSRWRSR